MKTKQLVAMAALAVAMSLSAGTVLAQNNDNNNNNNNQNRQRGNRGGFNGDPAQFQQQMLDRTKERLEITDDTEWNAIKPLVEKVMTAQRSMFADRMRGAFGRTRGGGTDNNTQSDQGNRGRGGFGGTPSAESEALRKAIDSKASNAELKAAVAKYVESRKTKQAELDKAQSDLRKVLSVRQEAIATESGLL
jgi:uncharacterized protein YdeI (BOF family)